MVCFGVLSLRQSHRPELSLHRDECEKNALYQRNLPNGLATAAAVGGPFSLSLRPFSLQAGNWANLVPSLNVEQNQVINSRHNPAEFESATAYRKIPQMFSHVPQTLEAFCSSIQT
jgi:hypothetical protein